LEALEAIIKKIYLINSKDFKEGWEVVIWEEEDLDFKIFLMKCLMEVIEEVAPKK
jgi:hypothetical protein